MRKTFLPARPNIIDIFSQTSDGVHLQDPEAPLIFPGKLLQDLPLDGRIRFGRITARSANLVGVSLSLESSPTRARNPR